MSCGDSMKKCDICNEERPDVGCIALRFISPTGQEPDSLSDTETWMGDDKGYSIDTSWLCAPCVRYVETPDLVEVIV